MYYLYVLYSASANKYYVGYTSNIEIRLNQHNNQESFNTYTKKHRPWILKALFSCGEDESVAMKLEKYIKSKKAEN